MGQWTYLNTPLPYQQRGVFRNISEKTISLNQKDCLRLTMDACGCTDHVKTVCVGHAGLTEERSVDSFSLLVEMCTEK